MHKVVSHESAFRLFLPANNKKDIRVHSQEKVSCLSVWDSGSRDDWQARRFELKNGILTVLGYVPVNLGTGFPSFQPGENSIPEGVAFIRTGTFRGKASSPDIYINPADYEKLCPDMCTLCEDCRKDAELAKACAKTGSRLSERQKKILETFTYTSAYRKREQERLNVSPEEIARLTEAGLIVKKGNGMSLSVEGRNAKDKR